MDTAWFKKRMRELGVNQQAIAQRLGRERDKVARIIKGDQPMRIDDALVFAEMLKVSYREIIERALDIASGGLDFGDEEGIPLRYHVAAMHPDSGSGSFEFTEPQQRLALPPKWERTPGSFAAEVMDQSFNRKYPLGSVIYCVPPDELERPMRVGDACVFLHLADGKPFEARGGILMAAPENPSFLLTGASQDARLSLTIWFERYYRIEVSRRPRGYRTDFKYESEPGDDAIIVGVVTASFRPEA